MTEENQNTKKNKNPYLSLQGPRFWELFEALVGNYTKKTQK